MPPSTALLLVAQLVALPTIMALSATSLVAQRSREPRQVVSIQPLHAALGSWAGEYERALPHPGTTIGLAAAVTRWDLREAFGELICWDACFTSSAYPGFATADLRLRSYEGGRAFAGEAWGFGVGAVTWRERRAGETLFRRGDARWSGRFRPSFTATYDFAQLGDGLPAQMAMGVGIRYTLDTEGTGVVPVWLTVRASVGVAF